MDKVVLAARYKTLAGSWWMRLTGLVVLAGLMTGCAWLDAKQRELIYRPTPGTLSDWKPITPLDEASWLSFPELAAAGQPVQQVRALWVPQPDPMAPTVLYLHGTFRNVYQNRPKIAAIHALGFAVLAIDYRGWGDSSARLPSEASILEDAELAFAELKRRVPEPARRVVYGHSMGSGVAVELAARHAASSEIGALVLESAFTSMPDIAWDRGGWATLGSFVATQRFASIERIASVTAPIWFIAGAKDNTVPSEHSRRLAAAAPTARNVVIIDNGSHSRLHEDDPVRYAAVWNEVATALVPAPAPNRR